MVDFESKTWCGPLNTYWRTSIVGVWVTVFQPTPTSSQFYIKIRLLPMSLSPDRLHAKIHLDQDQPPRSFGSTTLCARSLVSCTGQSLQGQKIAKRLSHSRNWDHDPSRQSAMAPGNRLQHGRKSCFCTQERRNISRRAHYYQTCGLAAVCTTYSVHVPCASNGLL